MEAEAVDRTIERSRTTIALITIVAHRDLENISVAFRDQDCYNHDDDPFDFMRQAGLANWMNLHHRCLYGTQHGDRHTIANGYRKIGDHHHHLHPKTNPSLVDHRSSNYHSFSNVNSAVDYYLDRSHHGDAANCY